MFRACVSAFCLGQPTVFGCQGQCCQLSSTPAMLMTGSLVASRTMPSIGGHRSQRTERSKLSDSQRFIVRLKDPWWTLRANIGKDRWQGTCHGQEYGQHVFTILPP